MIKLTHFFDSAKFLSRKTQKKSHAEKYLYILYAPDPSPDPSHYAITPITGHPHPVMGVMCNEVWGVFREIKEIREINEFREFKETHSLNSLISLNS